jgi:hypothetical protein
MRKTLLIFAEVYMMSLDTMLAFWVFASLPIFASETQIYRDDDVRPACSRMEPFQASILNCSHNADPDDVTPLTVPSMEPIHRV